MNWGIINSFIIQQFTGVVPGSWIETSLICFTADEYAVVIRMWQKEYIYISYCKQRFKELNKYVLWIWPLSAMFPILLIKQWRCLYIPQFPQPLDELSVTHVAPPALHFLLPPFFYQFHVACMDGATSCLDYADHKGTALGLFQPK